MELDKDQADKRPLTHHVRQELEEGREIRDRIRAKLKDMEPEHPVYVSVEKDLSDINAHMKQLLSEEMSSRAQDTTREMDTSDKEEDLYKEDISVDMETSDKDQETNEDTPMEVVTGRTPQKWKTMQSTLGEAFGVAKKKTKAKKEKKGRKKSNEISQSSQSQTDESVGNKFAEEETVEKAKETSSPKKSYLQAMKQTLIPTVNQEQKSCQIRVIFSFQGMQKKGDKGDGLKLILQKIAEDIYDVDPSAGIVPWEESLESRYPSINHTSVDTTDRNVLHFYMRSPERGPFAQNTKYWRQGVRISCGTSLRTFIDKWNNCRRVKKDMYPIQPAETQRHHRFALVGICQGSSPDKDVSDLQRSLPNITSIKDIDLSWQPVSVGRHTKKLWQQANDQATKEVQASCQHNVNFNSRKFAWGPHALSIFAPTEVEAKKARKILFEKYGKTKDGKFPEWPDGSRMKFLPLHSSRISNHVADQILPRVKWHIYAKANESSIEIPDVEIWKPIPNSGGKSIASYLHQYKDKQGTSVFRHVSHRWSRDPDEKRWEITVSKHMKSKATIVMSNLRKGLLHEFGETATNAVFPMKQAQPNGLPVSDLDAYYTESNNQLVEELLLEPGYRDLLAEQEQTRMAKKMEVEMDQMGAMDSDSTVKLGSAFNTSFESSTESTGPSIPATSVDENMSGSVHSDLSSAPSSSVATFGYKVDFDESSAKETLVSVHQDREEKNQQKILHILTSYDITTDRYEKLVQENQTIFDVITLSHDSITNIMKSFLKCLKNKGILRTTVNGAAEAGEDPDSEK